MNKGVIVGCVYDSDGYPYKGAIVTLARIVYEHNAIKLRDTYAKGNYSIDPARTNSDGIFGIPFFWDGVNYAEMLNASQSGSATIVAVGRTTGSCVEHARVMMSPDLSHLITMLPGGLIGGGKSKLFGNLIKKRMPTLKGIQGAPDLLNTPAPAKHASPENMKAVGGVEMWLKTK